MRTDKQIKEFAAKVAREAWESLNQVYMEYKQENGDEDDWEDCEVNLYVYNNDRWIIDNAQYLQDHRDIVAVVGLHLFNGPVELADEIEQEYNDEGIEEVE